NGVHPDGAVAGPVATGLSPVPPDGHVRPSVSLVVPAKNEARNLACVLDAIPDCVDEIILVDGDPRDATLAMAAYCRPDIRIVHQEVSGKGAALRAGFQAATGDI